MAKRQVQVGRNRWSSLNQNTHSQKLTLQLSVFVCFSVFLSHFLLTASLRPAVPPVSDETEKSPLTNSPQPPTALSAWGEGDSSNDYPEIVAQPDTIHWNLNIILTKLPSFFVFDGFMKGVFSVSTFLIGQHRITGDISLGGVSAVFYTIWGQCPLGSRTLRYDKPAGVAEHTNECTMFLCLSVWIFCVLIPIVF